MNDVLYHATYKPLLESIKNKGLGNTTQTFWSDSKPGVVYLAYDPDVAVSYAEVNEEVDEDWLDQIILLSIPIDKLDIDKLEYDKNVRDKNNDTLEYHGIIPWSNLEVVDYE